MAQDLWLEIIERAREIVELLKRIADQESDHVQVPQEIIICLDCGCNVKECVCG